MDFERTGPGSDDKFFEHYVHLIRAHRWLD